MPGPKRLITRKKQGNPSGVFPGAQVQAHQGVLFSHSPPEVWGRTLFPPLLGGKNKAECVSHTKTFFFFARVFGLLTDKGRSIAEAMLLPLFQAGRAFGPWVWARRRNPEYRQARPMPADKAPPELIRPGADGRPKAPACSRGPRPAAPAAPPTASGGSRRPRCAVWREWPQRFSAIPRTIPPW